MVVHERTSSMAGLLSGQNPDISGHSERLQLKVVECRGIAPR